MDVAIFDLDRTLTRYSTYTPFMLFAAFHRAPGRLLLAPIWILAMLGYALRLYDRKKLKEIGFALMIGRTINRDALETISKHFASLVLNHNLLADAVVRVKSEKAQGALLVLATASPDFYARHIANGLGFHHVIATRQRSAGPGRTSYRIDGHNCYGAAKLSMIEAAFKTDKRLSEGRHIRFYSDSASDAPTLAWAGGAFAVNPGKALRRLAAQNGWSMLKFA